MVYPATLDVINISEVGTKIKLTHELGTTKQVVIGFCRLLWTECLMALLFSSHPGEECKEAVNDF